MSEKLGAPHPTRYTDSQWDALLHEAVTRGCQVCDLLREFADSLDERQRRDYRLLNKRFGGNENSVNKVHQ
jgi:hypothetical protein